MPVLAAQATLVGVPCGTLHAVRCGALQHRLPSCDSGANGVCLCYCVRCSLDSTGNAGRERSLAWHGVALSSETESKIGPSCGQKWRVRRHVASLGHCCAGRKISTELFGRHRSSGLQAWAAGWGRPLYTRK